jgi:hypothetical protein
VIEGQVASLTPVKKAQAMRVEDGITERITEDSTH